MCAAQGPGEAGAPVWSPAVVLDTEARGAGVLELQGHVDAEQGNMEAGTRDQEAGPPSPAGSTGWGWGTGAEPVAAGSRALGLREAPPSPAGHPPWLSQHPAGPYTNFLLTGTSSEELLLFASKELLTKLGKNITFKLVL